MVDKKQTVTIELTKDEVCALFDLQFFLNSSNWADIDQNNMKEPLLSFFKKIETIDNNMEHDFETFKKESE